MAAPRYTVIIQWSEEDQAYVVSLPEWGGCKTHGDSYEEAARNAQEVLEMLIESEGEHPSPKLFKYPGADVMDVPDEALAKPRVVKTA
jgi:predicted RNase H-like HicB family nuclease